MEFILREIENFCRISSRGCMGHDWTPFQKNYFVCIMKNFVCRFCCFWRRVSTSEGFEVREVRKADSLSHAMGIKITDIHQKANQWTWWLKGSRREKENDSHVTSNWSIMVKEDNKVKMNLLNLRNLWNCQ